MCRWGCGDNVGYWNAFAVLAGAVLHDVPGSRVVFYGSSALARDVAVDITRKELHNMGVADADERVVAVQKQASML